MKLVLVDNSLIDITSKFASDVFIDYYNDLIGNKQASYMANLFLSTKAIEELISNNAIFKLAYKDDILAGFTEYQIIKNRVFLSKLYVKSDYRENGIGKFMLNDCIKFALENNINQIYLTVNKYNTKSYNTYLHWGFKVIDSVVNDIGNGYVMDDYIMQLDINNKES